MYDERVFSTQQAAGLCGVDRRSMLRWVKAGVLPSFQTGGGRWRIRRSDLVTFMRERGMPIPGSLDAGPPTVAIIDDDRNFVAAMTRLIAQHRPDARILPAHDGFAGGMLVAAERPDLLFLDVHMDGLDGLEVCRRIRSNPAIAGVRVVVLSGYLNEESKAAFEELGIESSHSKPVPPQIVHELLDAHLPVRAEGIGVAHSEA